jgi:hypothetical protein
MQNIAAAPEQRSVLHFRHHPAVSGEVLNGCHPHTPQTPDFAPCDFFLLPKLKLNLK